MKTKTMIVRKFRNKEELVSYCKKYTDMCCGEKGKTTGLIAFIPYNMFPDHIYFILYNFDGIRVKWSKDSYGVGYDSRRT